MSLPTENPYPNRNVLSNLRFEKSWKDIVVPEMREKYRATIKVQRAIAEQLLLVALTARNMYEKKKRPFHVSLIGCGQIGQILLTRLLEEGVRSDDIFVSTRQHELLSKFDKRGVRCTNDNEMVCKRASVVFILCGAHHVNSISTQLRGLIRQNAVLVSSLADFTREKIRTLFSTAKEQTIRTRIDIYRISSPSSLISDTTSTTTITQYTELACRELCSDKAMGLVEIYDAMVNLGRKLGIPEAAKVARGALFGDHGTFLYLDESEFQNYLCSEDAFDLLLLRFKRRFRNGDEDDAVLPLGV